MAAVDQDMTMQSGTSAGGLPLAEMRVVDLSHGASAAIGRFLAELGAQVIIAEVPDIRAATLGRDTLRSTVNALGKQALAGGQAAARELLPDADILIAGPAAAKLFDLEELHAACPALIILSVSDFGLANSLSEWKGSDAVYQALGGHLSRSGLPHQRPLLAPGQIAQQSAMVQACYAVLIAFVNRLKTGKGDFLDFATAVGAAQALDPGYGMQGSATSGVPASKLPRGRPEARFLYPILPCADGYVRLCILAKRPWRRMFEWMGSPEEFADPAFNDMVMRNKSATLLPAMTAFLADKTREEIEHQAEARGIPIAGLASLENALTNEQNRAREAFRTVTLPNGHAVPLPDGLLAIDGQRAGIAGPLPEPSAAITWRERNGTPNLAWADMASKRPLTGLRVLDLGVIVVGAEQGRLLADQGADVIKIENPSFPDGSRQTRFKTPMSPAFAAGHRNKRSLSLDLKSKEGLAILFELVAGADVLLSNFKPGTLDSLGLDEKTLRAANPALIMSDSSAFGSSGPWAGRMGYGPLVRAAAGLTELWRYGDDPASWCDALTVYPDHVAGRVGVIGVLALLIRRARTGIAGRASVSQAEVMLSHLAVDIAAMALAKQGVDVIDARPPGFPLVSPCRGDDDWCVVDPQGAGQVAALQKLLGEPGDLAAAATGWTADKGPMEAAAILQSAGIAAAPMLRVQEMAEFPYFHERQFFCTLNHPELSEAYLMENAPVMARNLQDPPLRPAPLMGQQSREVIADWTNKDEAEVDRLEAAGTIGGFILL